MPAKVTQCLAFIHILHLVSQTISAEVEHMLLFMFTDKVNGCIQSVVS